ncbi:Glucosamine-phosphate N-acetyltransferase-like protein [Mortierella claussenii]|nr:Glucosamine-phosphate N-acetyltransferase-like protein [Mortierella claussenii]
MSPQLFPSSLISSSVQAQLPEGYLLRPLESTDYHKGYFDCLAGLTVVGNVSEQQFQQTFDSMLRCQNVYHVIVIEDLKASRVVATGTLIVEQKFLRGCAKAGHIEDIVVHDSQRGKKFGIRLIDQLRHIAAEVGCYKLLLTCSEANEPFYQKSGFERKDLHMALYLNKEATHQGPAVLPMAVTAAQEITAGNLTTTSTLGPVPLPATTAASGTNSAEHNNNNNDNNINHNNISTESILKSSRSLNSHGVPMEPLSASMESVFVK